MACVRFDAASGLAGRRTVKSNYPGYAVPTGEEPGARRFSSFRTAASSLRANQVLFSSSLLALLLGHRFSAKIQHSPAWLQHRPVNLIQRADPLLVGGDLQLGPSGINSLQKLFAG